MAERWGDLDRRPSYPLRYVSPLALRMYLSGIVEYSVPV